MIGLGVYTYYIYIANSIGEADEKVRVWAVRYMRQVSRFANSMSQLSLDV